MVVIKASMKQAMMMTTVMKLFKLMVRIMVLKHLKKKVLAQTLSTSKRKKVNIIKRVVVITSNGKGTNLGKTKMKNTNESTEIKTQDPRKVGISLLHNSKESAIKTKKVELLLNEVVHP